MTSRPDLTALLARAREAFNNLTPEQQAAERQAQTESWVRGEMGMGLDRHEEAYRRQMEAGFPCKHTNAVAVSNGSGYAVSECPDCGMRVVI